MKAEILLVGGTVDVPGVFNAPYSTVVYLEDEEHKILIDPGSFVVHKVLEDRLREKGIRVEDVSDILLTHFHLDHAFNTIFFPNATIHLHHAYSEKNYERFGEIVGKLYTMVLKSWTKIAPFDDGDVIFGKINVLYSPWHAREHVSFFIETDNVGKIFLPGDICFTRLNYYEMVKGYRSDDVAKFVLENAEKADLLVFTHDEPLVPFS